MSVLRVLRVTLMVVALAAVGSACDDGDDSGADATATPEVFSTPPTAVPAETASATETPSDEQEVTGIVGAVLVDTGVIEINQLSGADVSEIAVTPATRIRRAAGGTLTLSQIRASDRIIASGAVDGQTLTATTLTVQDVVPGAQPGG